MENFEFGFCRIIKPDGRELLKYYTNSNQTEAIHKVDGSEVGPAEYIAVLRGLA